MAWFGQAFEHEADHCEPDEGCAGPRVTLEIAGQASIAADPGLIVGITVQIEVLKQNRQR